MLEEDTLAANLLQFRKKSFGFLRLLPRGTGRYAVFHRTETESESKLRPRLLGLWVLCPVEWLRYDEPSEGLLLGADGIVPGPEDPGSALETSAESERFVEQGLPWVRRPWGSGRFVYVPESRVGEFAGPEPFSEADLAP